ncbi:unnamed protein product [Mortierella alpina]
MHKERVQAAAQRKQESIQEKQATTRLTNGRWNRRLLKLCDAFPTFCPCPRERSAQDDGRWLWVASASYCAVSRLGTPKDLPNIERQLEQLIEQDPDSPVQVEVEQGPPVDCEDQDDRGIRGDLDDLGDGDEEEEANEEQAGKESSAATSRALLTITIMLIQSSSVTKDVDKAWVRRSSFRRKDFTEKECKAAPEIVNAFRPYIPKSQQDEDGATMAKPFPHIVFRAPFVLIANSLLRAAGYHEFVRRMMPQIAPSSLHVLHLEASGIYEVLCAESARHLDVRDTHGDQMMNQNDATKVTGNKQAIFAQFFNLAEIDRFCRAHGLQFNVR